MAVAVGGITLLTAPSASHSSILCEIGWPSGSGSSHELRGHVSLKTALTPLVSLSSQPGLNRRWKWTRTEDAEHVDMQRTSGVCGGSGDRRVPVVQG
jgi:hypothetical protein